MDRLKLDDFTRYKFLSNINLSPNGKYCGFVVNEIDLEENKYLSNIYILDDNNKKKRLTSLGDEKSFIWKDYSTLLFASIRNNKDRERKDKGEPLTAYYEINIDGGEANKVFEIPLNVTSLSLVDEYTYIITAEFNPMPQSLNDKKTYEIIDEIPFWSNGLGYTNKQRTKLYTYNVTNGDLHPITDAFSNVNSFTLNEDKTLVVFITSSFTDKMRPSTELNIYNLVEDKYEKISPYKDFYYSYCDFIDDKVVFAGTDMKSFGINENPSLYLTDYTGSNTYKISKLDLSIGNSVGSDCRFGSSRTAKVDKHYLYFTTTEGSSSYINRMDIHGNLEKLSSPNGSIDDFDIINNKLYFIGLRGSRLQEVYSLLDAEVQLTDFNLWVNLHKSISHPEKLVFSTDNDVKIEGYVLKPVDYKEGKLYPSILNIHGGPKTVYGEVFYHEMQYWANRGYFVFFCNPRGSDGYGNEFADIRGKYGTIDYNDIMDFTDLVLINYPDVDKNRIGVTGGSYGGFMTNWIIGHTARFKAAVSQRSISNWISFFGTSDIGYYFTDDQISGNPWDNIDKVWYHSPLKYADRVTTPTMFIHSEEDYRCWIPECLQMFTALKYHGVDSRLVAFKEENHELSRSGKPRNRIKRLEEIIAWFDKYLKV